MDANPYQELPSTNCLQLLGCGCFIGTFRSLYLVLRSFPVPCPLSSPNLAWLEELMVTPTSNSPGASEPRNMIYMSRLGIWGEGTPFRTFEDFLHAIEKR